MSHVSVVAEKRGQGGRPWRIRYRRPDGTWGYVSGFATKAAALTAAREAEREREGAYVFREGDYFVGRYPTPAGWLETEDGFDTAQDALDEARELERAARADAQPGV